MKGKIVGLRVILTLLIASVASMIFVVGSLPSQRRHVYAESTITTLAGEQYSALFEDNVIFSAEKVLVKVNGDGDVVDDCANNPCADNLHKHFYGADKRYTFSDLANEDKNKTVVDNGDLVQFDNVVNEDGSFSASIDSSRQEAILLSFGSYVYFPKTETDPEKVKIADTNTTHAGITVLDVTIVKDGDEDNPIIPERRNISPAAGGFYFDFTYFITQQKDNSNEGHYHLTFEYMVNSKVKRSEEFNFYLINGTSYTQSKDSTLGYNARPTLGWKDDGYDSEFEKSTLDENYVRYYIGKNGILSDVENYPTITYDYTKYALEYTHTANELNTKYTFDTTILSDVNGDKSASMVVSSSSRNGDSSSEPINLDYSENSTTNLATILLTEPGTYTINYKVLYTGYVDSNNVPNMDKIKTREIRLAIHGLSAFYSKTDFEGAKLQYFEIAYQLNNNVSLIVPNGYKRGDDISHLEDSKLSFVYDLVENSDYREGTVISANSKNSLINAGLGDNYNRLVITPDIAKPAEKNIVTEVSGAINDLDDVKNLDQILTVITYTQTNQGSIWIEGNDSYTNKSFYYYSQSKISVETLYEDVERDSVTGIVTYYGNKIQAKKEFNNTTSFNSKGYYLVFVEVAPTGLKDSNQNYWQIFAFQYTSSSVDIKVEAVDENGDKTLVANGKYTNKKVEISWVKPEVFDRAITPYYYSANTDLTKEDLLKTTKNNLHTNEEGKTIVATLGENVQEGTFTKFMLRLESEGESATHKIFTIDKQGISGVQPYLVQAKNASGSVYYAYARKNGEPVKITNSITDSYATIDWDDKASGAATYASYSYTPFSINTDPIVKTDNMITTNYGLGTTIEGTDLQRPISQYNVSSECVLFNQGIYIVKIWDDAGNVCYYGFIIDRTPNYIFIENDSQFISNNSAVYGKSVDFVIGTHKIFELDTSSLDLKKEGEKNLKTFVECATTNNWESFKGYYSNNATTNKNTISNYFIDVNGSHYFAVENNKVSIFERDKLISTVNKQNNPTYFTEATLEYDPTKLNGAGSLMRTFYVQGANHQATTSDIKDYPYVTIEVNPDNARGSVYYTEYDQTYIKTHLPKEGQLNNDDETIFKLNFGSDGKDEQGRDTNGLKGAGATSAKNIMFIWNMGSDGGNFVVSDVYYSFYTLNTKADLDDKFAFYQPVEKDIYLCQGGKLTDNAEAVTDGSQRAMVKFNGTNDSRAGLYVVTRTYKEDPAAGSLDVKEKKYYFIVDRNGIIDATNVIGSEIRIDVMEDRVDGQNLSSSGIKSDSNLVYDDDDIDSPYTIYLSTTKLPATLNIPTGKYFYDGKTSASYDAGKLNIQVYFKDSANQLKGENLGKVDQKTIKIFDSTAIFNDQSFDYEVKDGVFVVDVYKYLTNVDPSLRDRITLSDKNGTWLFLSGEYIVRITDKVVRTTDKVETIAHEKYIGFRITGKTELLTDLGPQIDVYNDYSEAKLTPVNTNVITREQTQQGTKGNEYVATVNQQWLNIAIPTISSNNAIYNLAEVDKTYLVVSQEDNGVIDEDYINHAYTRASGSNFDLTKEGAGVKILGDKIVVSLDAKLFKDGVINTQPLTYTIKVRYKLNNLRPENYAGKTITDFEKYKDCYVYYDDNDNEFYYYYSTYIIKIDRQAPQENITKLNQEDILVQDYAEYFETSQMMKDDYWDSASNYYFTTQYAKYYEGISKNAGYLYAYQVYNTTELITTDVEKFLIKNLGGIADLKNKTLSLPVVNESSYNSAIDARLLGNKPTYANLGGLSVNNYYEIVELDAAGNATQYIIHYLEDPDNPVDPNNPAGPIVPKITIPVTITDINNDEVLSEFGLDKGQNFTILGIAAGSGVVTWENENFFKITLSRAGETNGYTIFTTASTDFQSLKTTITSMIPKTGAFNLTIETRQTSTISTIDIYDTNNISKLIKAEDKVVKNGNGNYSIIYGQGDYLDETTGLYFYAKEINIKTPDGNTIKIVGSRTGQNTVVYDQVGGPTNVESYLCTAEGTYLITMLDVLKNKSAHILNTVNPDYEDITFDFADPDLADDKTSEHYYVGNDGKDEIYYGYTIPKFKYDKTVYNQVDVYKKNVGGVYMPAATTDYLVEEDGTYNAIELKAKLGGAVQYKIVIKSYEFSELDDEYYFVIDQTMPDVTIRDNVRGAIEGIIKINDNTNYKDAQIGTPIAGIMNLHWSQNPANDHFYYEYLLYEKVKVDDVDMYQIYADVQNKTVQDIVTNGNSLGIYMFEIRVYGLDGTFVGNRVHGFKIEEISNKIYYVRERGLETSQGIESEAQFKFSELVGKYDSFLDNSEKTNLEALAGDITSYLPLFISNKELEVVVLNPAFESKKVLDFEKETGDGNKYSFKLYKIRNADTNQEIYVGIMEFTKHDSILVNDVKIVSEYNSEVVPYVVNKTTAYTIAGKKGTSIRVTANKLLDYVFDVSEPLLSKNKLNLEVLYNGMLIERKEFIGKDEAKGNYVGEYIIEGNGQYSFVFRDLAGNVHEYQEDKDLNDLTSEDALHVYALREVVALVNGQAPVDNAFYNEQVKIELDGNNKYKTGSVSIVATKNGEPYKPEGFGPYYFKDYGNYRVVIKAEYDNKQETESNIIPVEKVLTFTIINIKEARTSIDLTALMGHKITSVTNQNGEDVKVGFEKLIEESLVRGGMNISYQDAMKYSDDLKITTGKITFNITYVVSGGIYPEREITASFTLNNETPTIKCSMDSGESTTKKFYIYFNPSIIYEQIGEAYVYINDEIVTHINEASANEELKIKRSFKSNGDGDYYIKLVSSSGVVLDSYKVTIKEPLNFWAIVVIIAVVAVVVTVVVTIIVLRRKMRIR